MVLSVSKVKLAPGRHSGWSSRRAFVMSDLFHLRTGSRSPKTLATTLWLAGVAGTSSCVFHKAPGAFNPPPVSAKAAEPIPPAALIALPPEVAFEPVVYDFPSQTDPSSRFPELPPPRVP